MQIRNQQIFYPCIITFGSYLIYKCGLYSPQYNPDKHTHTHTHKQQSSFINNEPFGLGRIAITHKQRPLCGLCLFV